MAKKKTHGGEKLKALIIAIIIAVAAWTIVAYTTDLDMTRTITGVRAELVGAEELREHGFVVLDSDELPRMSVSVTGKRSDLMSVMEDMRIVLDVSAIDKAGDYRVQGTVKMPNTRVSVERIMSDGVDLTIDKLETREVKIVIYQDGEVEGKIAETLPQSETVMISGATSELDKINGAYATIDLGTVKEAGKVKLPVQIAPKDGVSLDDLKTLVLQNREVEVENVFYEPQTVKVYVTASGVTGYDIDQGKTKVSPEEVTVGVRPGYTVTVVTATVTEKTDNEISVSLNDTDSIYIPQGVRNVKITPVWAEVNN